MRLDLLGPLRVTSDSGPVPLGPTKSRLLFATFLLDPNQVLPHHRLVEALWGDEPPASAQANLRTYVFGLRRALGSREQDRLRPLPGGYQMVVHPLERDVDRFAAVSGHGRAALASGNQQRALAEFDRALSMVRSPDPLSGLPLTPSLSKRVAPITDMWLTVEEEYAELLLAQGAAAAVVPRLRALLNRFPLRQRAWAQLMLGLYRLGDVAGALEAFREAQQTLSRELGLDPAPELIALHDDILHNRSGLSHPGQTVAGRWAGLASAPPAVPVPADPADTFPRQLPHQIRHFVGRAKELGWLDRLLEENRDNPGTVVIAGMAGAGKTSLATRWAHQVAHLFPDGQLHVDLRGYDQRHMMPPTEALRGFLEALGVSGNRMPPDLEGRSGLFRSLLSSRRTLVVLDNAHDSDQVRPLLPGPGGCLVMVTSRDRLTKLIAREDARPLMLDVLTQRESRELLASRIGAGRLAAEPDATDDIIATTGGLPLVLAIVAARISTHPGSPLRLFAKELRVSTGLLDALDEGEVREIFSWSYQALGEPAARLFRLLGLHPGPDLTAAAAAALAGTTVSAVAPALRELARLHLLAERCPGRYAFHDLLRVYAVELGIRLGDADEFRTARRRLFDHYLGQAHPAAVILQPQWQSFVPARPLSPPIVEPPADVQAAEEWMSAEQTVLLHLIREAGETGFEIHAWQLAWSLTTFLAPRGLWPQQKRAQQYALTAAERVGDPVGAALAHRLLGRALTRLRDLNAAEYHLRRALLRFRELDDPAGEAQTLHNLIEVSYMAQRFDEAVEHGEAALPLHRRARNHAGEARTLNAIGWVHATAGDYERAIDRCSEALAHQRSIGDHNGQAATLDSLGYAYHRLGQHQEAVRYFEEAIALFRQSADRYHEAETMIRLGDVHQALSDPEAARAVWREAAASLEEFGDPLSKEASDRLEGASPDA
ncbi:AfsR/SARP family transcriptional regulator [Streptomyces tendae]